MINKILNIARGELGYKEGANNNTKYGADYGMNYNPWCQMFIWWIANKAEIGEEIIPKMASCPAAYNWFKNKGQVVPNSEARPGDIIFFIWTGNTAPDHVGIVENVNSNIITTIEGNKNDAVERRNVSKDNKCIFAICRPAYIIESVEETIPEVASNVKYVNTTAGLNIRANANTTSNRLGAIPYKKEVSVIEENCANANGYAWDKIQYNNIVGYVANKYLTPVETNTTTTYIVQKGDNLSKIAQKYNTTWQTIYNNNRSVIGNNPNLIKVGQVLKI